MGITMNSLCFECQLRKKMKLARSLGTDEQATAFGRKIMQALIDAPAHMDSTWFGALAEEMLRQDYGLGPDRLKEEKAFSNRFAMERIEEIRKKIRQAEDPVYAALQYCVMGNYIDFSALQGEVSYEKLDQMLETATNLDLEKATYQAFCQDLEKGKNLLYLTDNAGEIAFDCVTAEILQERYPHLQITFCVRGAPAFNDALREDAQAVGVPFPVIDNGTAIGGTEIPLLGLEAKEALDRADVILAKGMGNVETMYGSGYPIYYAFLIKCQRLIQIFGKPMLTPMLLSERRSGKPFQEEK